MTKSFEKGFEQWLPTEEDKIYQGGYEDGYAMAMELASNYIEHITNTPRKNYTKDIEELYFEEIRQAYEIINRS